MTHADRRAGSKWVSRVVIGVMCCICAEQAAAQTLPSACQAFTDPALPVTTPVKAAHVAELRGCINAIRALQSLSAYTWTDASLTPGVSAIKAVHISELRTALNQVYSAMSRTAPPYTDPTLTAGVTTIEFEPGAVADLTTVFDELAPRHAEYEHHRRWGDDNGSSHVRAALLGPSITVPFTDGAMTLGTWQQIVLLEFDTRPRRREVVVQILGD